MKTATHVYLLRTGFCLLLLLGISTISVAQNQVAATGSDSAVKAPAVTPVLASGANEHPQQQSSVQPKLAASDQTTPETSLPGNNPAVQPKKD